ncbi:hypothetical protein BHAOGJBA_5729 [Methylobacterium hispanicum]|uniref:Hemagglutinin n=1 Tax=Methylobacterium hispanicum TaxID=270350 RepID=A0AAV4ZVP8_9HYPH|nr:Ig-like domain-containing protein [Methylobacterium hispanicum]GJD92176.1 hypothetical protein BHAOGJBA_5729 [Methylobacterium hispanicum]
MAAVTQTFENALNQTGNPLVLGGFVYAQRSYSGAATGTLAVQNFTTLFSRDAQLQTGQGTGVQVGVLDGSGYLSISQASGGQFDFDQLDFNSGTLLGAATNTYFVGFRNGVQVVSGDAFQLLNLSGLLGDQQITFGDRWDGLTEVRIFNGSLLDLSLGRLGFRIDDVVLNDRYAPGAPSLSAGVAVTGDNTPTLTGTAEVGSTVAIFNGATQIGTVTAGANGQFAFTPTTPLADGTYTLTARATDAAGNASVPSTSVALTIDTAAPGAPSVTAPALTNDSTPTITGTAEAGTTVTLLSGTTVLGTAVAGANGTYTFTPTTPLPDATYVLRATTTDAAGNVSGASAATSVRVDTIAPVVPAFTSAGGTTTDNTPTLTGTAEAGATVTILNDTAVLGTTVAGSNGTFSFTPTTPLPDGPLSLTARATDAAGNASPTSAALGLTIDATAPAAPVLAAFTGPTNDTTPTITGTAEAGATVTVLNGTTVLGTAIADANGAFSVTPALPLPQGTARLTATATDAAGNTSVLSAATPVTIDTLAPAAPVLAAFTGPIGDTTPDITGTAEVGATVTVTSGATVLGTAVAGADGRFTLTPTGPLPQGTSTLTATATDLAGNTSPASTGIAVTVDSAAPAAPVITTAPDSTSDPTPTITGTAEAGATVTVLNGTAVLGTAVADTGGAFSFTPTAPLADGTLTLTATARDVAGNVGPASAAVALTIDTAAPGAPTLNALPATTADNTPEISGTAEAGATVTIANGTTVLGTAVAGANGAFTFTPEVPLPSGPYTLTATATDAAGNTGPASNAVVTAITAPVVPDTTPPAPPVLDAFPTPTNDTMPTITGSAEVGAVVTITNGPVVLGSAIAGADGSFSFTPTTPLTDGATTLTAVARDLAGNPSGAATVTVTIDTAPPAAPTFTTPAASTDATPAITGTAEAGAAVTIANNGTTLGTAVAGTNGTFTFTPAAPLAEGLNNLTATATDVAGNTSAPVTATLTVDTTGPDAPVLNPFPALTPDNTPAITGTAEAGTTVTIANGTTVLGTAVADTNGAFSFTPTTALADGTLTLTATAADALGNVSAVSGSVTLTIDATAPAAPVLDTFPTPTNDTTPAITGTAEAGTTVTIANGTTVLGTAVADGSGSFSFTPTTPLPQGTSTLTATATDLAGNTSPASTGIAVTVDSAAPAAPVITTAPGSTSDTTPTITGTAEVGATVTIANNGTVLGTAIADANGAFSFTPAAPLPDETLSLTATAADALGNVSAASSPVTLTIDTSPPAAPDLAALPDATNDTTPLITGTAEAGTTVTLLNNGVPIGTALADADGRFSLTPGTPLTGGANSLTATATDAAGNTGTASSPVTLTVDLLAPGAPVLTAFPNPTNDTTPTITGAAEAGATVTIASNGTTLGTVVAGTDGAFSFTPTTALAEGANSLTATATDAAGNVSLAAQTPLRVDLTPPPAPAVDPLPATTGDTTPTITGTAKAGATVTVLNGNVVLGTVVAGAGGAFSFTPTTPLPVGTASLTATATDVAGNTGPASATIVLEITPPPVAGDTTPPDAPVLTAFPNPTNESQPAITGTAEAGATVTIASNGAEIGSVVAGPSGTFSFTPTTSLPEGANTLTATATDAAGNTSPAGQTVLTVDLTPPAPPVLGALPPATDDSTPTITGTTEPNATVTIANGTTVLGTAVADPAGNFSFTPSAPLPAGTASLSATATDVAGNTGTASAAVPVVITAPPVGGGDTTPPDAPVLTGFTAPTNNTTPTISGTAEPGATVSIANNGAEIGSVVADANGAFSFTPTTPLTAEGNSLTATATDAAGNVSPVSTAVALTIDTTPPAAPTLTGLPATTDDTTPTITGTTEPNATVTIANGGTVLGTAAADEVGNFSFTPTAALPAGTASLTATARDVAGNTGPASAAVSLLIDPGIDAPPTATLTVATTADGVINAAEAAATAFTVTGLDTGTTASASFSAGGTTVTVPVVADGSYAADLSGLTGPVSTSLVLTGPAGTTATVTGPTLALDTVAPAGTASASTADGPAVASFTYTVSFPEAVTGVGVDDFLLTGTNGAAGTITGVTGSGGSYTVTVAGVTGSGILTLGLAPASDIADLAGNAATLVPASRDVTGIPPVQPVITGYSDDTGVPGDNVTNDNTPTIRGIGAPGATVTLTAIAAGAAVTATGAVAADGTWTVALPALADGFYSITATLTAADGGAIGTSGPLALTIDRTLDSAPTATLGLDATADGVINGAEAGAVGFTVAGLDPGTTGTVTFTDGIRQTSETVGADGTYTVDLSGFSGTVNATLGLSDAAGNVGTVPGGSLTVATGLPGAPVIAALAEDTGLPGDGLTSDTTPTLSGGADPGTTIRVTVGTPAGPVTVEAQADAGGAWTATLPALADGAYAATAVAIDAAGNAGPASDPFPIRIDATVPAGTAVADAAGGPAAQSFTVAVSFPEGVSGVGVEDFVLTGTNGAAGTISAVTGSGGSYTVTVTGVTGTGTLSLGLAQGSDIADAAGNLASLVPATRPVAVGPSAAPPTITGFTDDTGVPGDGITRDATPTLTGTGIPNGTVEVRYDGAPGAPALTGNVAPDGTWSLAVPTLADGTYVFSVTTRSADGALASATADALRLTIDTVADSLPAVALSLDGTADGVLDPDEAAAATFTLTGLDADAAAVVTFTDGTRTVTANVAADGAYTADLSTLSGTVTASVTVSDVAGNIASANGNAVVVGAQPGGGGGNGGGGDGGSAGGDGGGVVTPPPAPATPVIAGIQDDTGTPGDGVTADATPTVFGTGTPGSSVTIAFTDAGNPRSVTGTVGADGSWQVALPALADGTYSLVATTADGAGTASAPSQALPITIDTVVPTAPVLEGAVGQTGGSVADPTPALTGTAEPGTTVEVVIDTPTTPVVVTGVVGSDGRWTVEAPTLADGSYGVTVTAVDTAGNRGPAAGPVTLVIDTTPGDGTGGGTGDGGVTPPGSGLGEEGGPALVADLNQTVTHAPAITGNLLANDAGGGLQVTAVRFSDGLTVAVPSEGAARVVTDFGTLTVSADGSYSYQAIGANNLPVGFGDRQHFTYTAADAAGRTAESTLDIQLDGVRPQASASFDFSFTQAKVGLAGEALVLVGPDGVVTDVSGIDTLNFTDGQIQNNDGNRLVDDIYYYAKNLDVWQAHVDADLHYAVFGWHEGRDPNAYFRTGQYLAENPDVAAAGVNPLEHYLQSGEREGRSPGADFSAEAYLHSNPDVAASGSGALAHYLNFGRAEGRTVYAGESDGPNPAIGGFDASFYLAQNRDVAASVPAGVTPESYALQHYLNYGAAEARNPNALFDTAFYLQQNPDVAATGENPLLHYQEVGWHEGRNPSAAFDTDAYLARNPDVAAAGIDPLAHYIQYGLQEGRALA